MKTIRTACPRDCQDCCSILATVNEEGQLVKVEGDPDHPMTQGFLCTKGLSYPELIYHPRRICRPLFKTEGKWQPISWKEALDFLVDKIQKVSQKYGPEAILHYHYSGSEGLTKKITQRFFAALGSTGVQGDLCLSGGIAAQIYDLGGLEQNDVTQITQAKGCVVWGRNIPSTNLHLLPWLKKAQGRGMEILVVNPLFTGLEGMATTSIQPRPGTDGALALGVCQHLIETGRLHNTFIQDHVHGFQEFARTLADFSLERTAQITGVTEEDMKTLASFYHEKAPVTTLLGYGLQRYRNGGNTIRAIDALAAITGNIGNPGAGVSYCSDTFWPLREHLQGSLEYNRLFSMTHLAQDIQEARPKIQLAVIGAANPVVNIPQAREMKKALAGIETVVVSDLFLTDTAQEGHLFLPCTSFLEEENVRLSSWSPWIYSCPQVIAPVGEARSDEEVILELARRLQIGEVPWTSTEELLQWALQPLAIRLEDLQKGHLLSPQAPTLAWKDKQFRTPSGKVELYSEKAKEEGQSPTATYQAPAPEELPLSLLSPHSPFRIHSQFQNTERAKKNNPSPRAVIHPETGAQYGIEEGKEMEIFNQQGKLVVKVEFSLGVHQELVSLESGWSQKSGGCASNLIRPRTTEMGDCAALYDVRVGIRKGPGEERG